MVSFRAKFFMKIMKLMSLKEEGVLDIEKQRKDLENNVFLFRKPRKMKVQSLEINGISAEWLHQKDQIEDRAILYLHGGSYNAGSLNTHRSLAARIGKVSSSPVLSIDYRLAPENPFPAALEDAVSAYIWLIEHKNIKPNKIAIAGDSAGGGLTFATLLKLREEEKTLPACAIGLSPWTDLALTGDSIKTKADVEIMLTENEAEQSAVLYLKDIDLKHPLASPLYADLKGLPPLLIQTGTAEIILDDSTRFAEEAEKSGVKVILDLWAGMFHVFQIFGNLMPESKKALEKIGDFIKENFS
ncbi:MAG: alpha/beta hydrolase [Candidatus Heimdallarchaeota archaeon]|nr:MAG: alpha/beta hydrolase [Candidatus Heimdallarchaeota archaeon]